MPDTPAAATTAFTVKVDDRTFVLDRITLGDWRMFKTEFGLNASDIISSVPTEQGPVEVLNLDNPSVLSALLTAALRHERPHASLSDLIAEVDELGMEGLTFPDLQQDEEEADPTLAGDDASGETGARSKSGSSAKRRKNSGSQN